MYTNLSRHLNSMWKVFAGGGTVLAYQAYAERVAAREWAAQQKEILVNMERDFGVIKTKLEEITDEALKSKLISEQLDLKERMESIQFALDKINEKLAILGNENVNQLSNEIVKDLEYYTGEIGKQVKVCLTNSEDLRVYLDKWKDKNQLFDDNPIWDWIHDFNIYLSTLSIYELCFLINILMSTFILSCLISILLSFYGSILIEKFNLESKFPRLSGLIKLRVKLLHSSVLINSLLIVIAVVFLLYLNIHTLLLK